MRPFEASILRGVWPCAAHAPSNQPKVFHSLADGRRSPLDVFDRISRFLRNRTVDKFQGQEAPVVFYSMATSTPEDAPRGMEFLYSRNRLNVATSRAQCLTVLVASPALFDVQCKTPRQMELANSFCRYLEIAQVV